MESSSQQSTDSSRITEAEIAELLLDDDKVRKLAKGALIEIVHSAPRNVSLVGACKELLDRIDGKAPQSLSMTVKTDPAASLTDDQLVALLALLPDPVIIPPMPKKLDVDDSNG